MLYQVHLPMNLVRTHNFCGINDSVLLYKVIMNQCCTNVYATVYQISTYQKNLLLTKTLLTDDDNIIPFYDHTFLLLYIHIYIYKLL